MTTSKLADKHIVERNKIRNQCTFLRGQAEEGGAFFLDKVEETTSACDNLLLTWKRHESPQGDRKVKETMHCTASRILMEIEQWRDNSSTEDTLTSLTLIQTLLENIREMNHTIVKEEEEAAIEFPSILSLLIKKISIAGNKTQIRQWWYDTMTLRPPPLPKHEGKHREEILDRVEEGWHQADWAVTMPKVINEILHQYPISMRNPTVTRTSHATEGIQWIRMEEVGKALTNRCRAVRELPNKKHKKKLLTRDRHKQRKARIRVSTQNSHTKPHPRTPQSGNVLFITAISITHNQPGPFTTTGRHVAKPQHP